MNIAEIQEQLQKQKLDGWLFFDHHQRDPLAYHVLGLHPARHVTRRWYYLIPAEGEPRGLVHRIEAGMLDSVPGDKIAYSSWTEQVTGLGVLLKDCRRVAMQYSPDCAIPYVSLVDGGTIDLVRGRGVEIVSSAELIQYFEARLDARGMETHLEAGVHVDRVRAEAFRLIGERLGNGVAVDELAVKTFMRERFEAAGLITDSGPIVAVNKNAGNPHYEPEAGQSSPIRPGDLVLLDMWAKLNDPDAVYYDITWTGFCGPAIPERIQRVFAIVTGARDRAFERVRKAMAERAVLRGFEVDDTAREYIRDNGYGDRFIHRTGHSIGREVHGTGANMDNLETHDDRKLMPWSCFSIEPGIYLEDFGIRSEVDVFLDGTSTPRITGEIQTELFEI